MTIDDLLKRILNPHPGGNMLAQAGQGYLPQTGLAPEAVARFHEMSGIAPQIAPQGSPPAGVTAPPPQTMPQVSAASPVAAPAGGGGIGGFLSQLFGGGQSDANPNLNETADWLVKQGIVSDPSTALAVAGNKQAMQKVLESQVGGEKLIEVNGRLINPRDPTHPVADYSTQPVPTRTMTPAEVKAAGLAPGVWQVDKDNRISKAGDAAPDPTAPFRFDGASIEGQALNGLMDSGALTIDQAQQLAAGKTITNPADGSIMFVTPRGIFSQPANGGPATPVTPDQSQGTPAPQPGMPPPANGPIPAPTGTPTATPEPVNPAVKAAVDSVLRPGMIPLTSGKPGKLATASEERNRSLYTVAAPELKRVEENFGALQNIYSQAASRSLPWGLDNYVTSPEYQRASNALTMIAQTFIYSASGQAAPAEEVNKIVRALTPMPGESPESVADKLERLKGLVSSIRLAGGNAIVEPPAGVAIGDGSTPPRPATEVSPAGVYPPTGDQNLPPVPEGVDPKLWKYMTPEQRALWQ